MAFPPTRTDVPRDEVHSIVRAMLLNPDVGDVECEEQSDGKYTVRPKPRVGSG